jgi:hypothetical protein
MSDEFVFGVSTFATLAFGYVAGIAFFYSENIATRVGGVFLALSAIAAAIGLGALGWKIAWMGTTFVVAATIVFVYRQRPQWMPHRRASEAGEMSTEQTGWSANYRALPPDAPKNE